MTSLETIPSEHPGNFVDEVPNPYPVPNEYTQCLNCDDWLSFGQECECHYEQGDGRGISY